MNATTLPAVIKTARPVLAEPLSILVLSPDSTVAGEISRGLARSPDFDVQARPVSLSELMAHEQIDALPHRVVIVDCGELNRREIAALTRLSHNRLPGQHFVAVVSGELTLTEARELTRAGASEVLPQPVSVSEIIERLYLWVDGHEPVRAERSEHNGKVIAVTQARGGIGSTTVAVNLAHQLLGRSGLFRKRASRSVALVDFDLQFGAVSSYLDIPSQDNLFEMAAEDTTPDRAFLEETMAELPSGLRVLAAPTSFAPIDALSDAQVEAILRNLTRDYDYVVVDMPRALVSWISPVLQSASRALMVTDTSVHAIRQARRLMDFCAEDAPQLTFDIVVNHESKPLIMSSNQRKAAAALRRELGAFLPHDARTAREAEDTGKPIAEVAPNSRLDKAFQRLAQAMETTLSQQTTARS